MKFVALCTVPELVVIEIFPVVAPLGTRAKSFADVWTTNCATFPLNFTDSTPVKPCR